MITISHLWNSNREQDWKNALEYYWNLVQPKNMALERELNDLRLEEITGLDPLGWYHFLHDKYFDGNIPPPTDMPQPFHR